MRATRRVLLLSATVCLGRVAPQAAPPPAASSSNASADVADAAVTVRAALSLELDGLDEDRNALLQQVIDRHPDYAPACAHRGEIRVGEKWLPYDRVVHEGDRWHQLYMYRKTRDERGDTIDDHLFMVDGARQRKMWDEERSHLMRILERDANHLEAHQRLGDVRIDDVWVAREEVVQFVRDLVETRRNLAQWGPQINPIARRLLRSREQAWDSAAEELKAIRDPGAIPALELALSQGGEREALFYLDWLAECDAWQASVALSRQAVLSASTTIRSQAQQRLKDRRIDDYVPVLLTSLRADPQVRAGLTVTPGGGLLYVQHISYETQRERRERNLAVLYGPENLSRGIPGRVQTLDTLAVMDMPESRAWALNHLRQYYGAFSFRDGLDLQSQVEHANGRVQRTLATAVNRDDLRAPQDWWNWWTGYQEVHVSNAPKPLVGNDYEEIWAVERTKQQMRRVPFRLTFGAPATPFGGGSCFPAGTPVVTEFGPKPIEEVRLGDRVLSQDVDTGELAFKPVFGTTLRPAVPLLKLVTAHGDIATTGGHPFWVNGAGWLKARELQPGMRFHAVTGSSEILAVEDAARSEKAHNLVVADFHTYFVGEGRVLCHDNTPRNPTNSLVPGLEKDFTVALAQ